MFSYKRLEDIFIKLYEEEFQSKENIAFSFSVSERTIRNDINELNDLLRPHNAQIVNLRGKGYVLSNKKELAKLYEELKMNINQDDNMLESSEDRIKQLLLLLVVNEDYLTLDEIGEEIFVGRTTLLSYIRIIRQQIIPYELKVVSKANVGYKLVGEEINIRQCIMEQLIEKNFGTYIIQFSSIEKKLFREVNLTKLSEEVLEIFSPRVYKISDYNRKNFIIHLAIAILRVKKNHIVEEIPTITLFDAKVQAALEELLEWVQINYQIEFQTSEKKWIYKHFFSELLYKSNSMDTSKQIYTLIDQILVKINKTFGEDLTEDTILRNDLYTHFSSYLLLKQILITEKNPLLATIKTNYSYAFELATFATKNTELANTYHFSEDDIGYVALHIAAALERKRKAKRTEIRVAIVCGQGVATSRLLEALIKQRFPDEIEIVDILSFASYKLMKEMDVNFIVSTVPLINASIPVILVDFSRIKDSLNEIQKYITLEKKKSNLYDLFERESFIFQTTTIDKEPFIDQLCLSLEENEYITTDFKNKVMSREEMLPTNITSFMAIPHAISSEISKSKIIVGISKIPIKWSVEDEVKIVFLLAVSENDKDKLQLFFEYLSEIIDDNMLQKELAAVENFDQFIRVLKASKIGYSISEK